MLDWPSSYESNTVQWLFLIPPRLSSQRGVGVKKKWDKNSLNPGKQLQSTQLNICILGEMRIQPSSGLCSSCPHSGSCVTLVWARLPHSELNVQLLVFFVDICLTSGLRAAMQKKTFRQAHTVYALCEPTLKVTKEIWSGSQQLQSPRIQEKHRINFFPFIL